MRPITQMPPHQPNAPPLVTHLGAASSSGATPSAKVISVWHPTEVPHYRLGDALHLGTVSRLGAAPISHNYSVECRPISRIPSH